MMRIHSVQAIAHIQDLGRFGLRRFGIGHAGAMDTLALQAGNLLLGNETGAAALEIALGGISVSFTRDTARRGQTLTLKRAVQGMYGYLCVAGGFDVPEILGARSTDLKAAFGGFQGHCLQAGDEVPLGAGARSLSHIGVAPITPATSIRALPSSEYAAFGLDAQRALWQQPWVLQSNSNRMGYRFSGETLALAQPLEMLSHAVPFGTIQVPPSGQPIVLMADTQTTGGYPKIACVVAADLGRLAQVRFGSEIYFQICSAEEAAKLHLKNQIYLNQIKRIADYAR